MSDKEIGYEELCAKAEDICRKLSKADDDLIRQIVSTLNYERSAVDTIRKILYMRDSIDRARETHK